MPLYHVSVLNEEKSMNVNSDYSKIQEVAELARKRAEEAKTKREEEANKAETARTNATKEATEAEEASKAVDSANEKVGKQENVYTQANSKVASIQSEYESALSALNALSGSEDKSAIASAQSRVDSIKARLEQAQAEAQREYDALVRAQQDAQTAQTRYEIEQKEADTAQKELEDAETALKTADEELQTAQKELEEAEKALAEAEEAEKAAEAEEAEKAKEAELAEEVSPLTEEEALEQGYKVIKTVEDLIAMGASEEALQGRYILLGDIDLDGVDWSPVGNSEFPFTGVFNGNGFTIKNVTISTDGTDDTDAVGFFGYTKGAEISNVVLDNINVSAPEDYNKIAVGGLIGRSTDTNINNVALSGTVTGHQGVGGLIGIIQDSQGFGKVSITNVNANVDVNSNFYAGGLIGRVMSTDRNSLMLDNCHTNGELNITDMCAGGLIGEAGKTVITVNRCSSSMNINKIADEDFGLSWLLDDTSRFGGIIGNCNGTYISVCNSKFTGSLNCDDEFKGDVYGWYMNDAQVSIFELSAGLPVDDILNIEGVEGITPIIDPNTGAAYYNITVSTLAGMNRIVDMIQNNPTLAKSITFDVQFDFETMDKAYDQSVYKQYGVVQLLYEDENGNVVNDVYIDNEVDLESNFNVSFVSCSNPIECKIEWTPTPKPTMVAGLYKDGDKYYIETPGTTVGDFKGFTEVSLEFFFENQTTIVTKRLDSDEVKLRDNLVAKAHRYQSEIQSMILAKYGYSSDDMAPLMEPPEYKHLKKKLAKGETLTPEEMLKVEIFELNYTIMNIVGEITRNEGCGMGGNASFLERDKGVPLEDAYGRVRYQTIDGIELRQKLDEEGKIVCDDDGNPLFETLEGEVYDGSHGSAYVVRGFPVTDEDKNMLYTDADGKTVVRKDGEDGTTYSYEDGTEYTGEPEELTQQLEEDTPQDMSGELDKKLEELKQSYQ